MNRAVLLRSPAALVVLAAVLASPAHADPVRVVTTIAPLAMLASQIGGQRVVVHALLAGGADPHTYEPKPSDAASLQQADVVLALGSPIDDWLGAVEGPRDHAVVVKLDGDAEDAGGTGHDDEAGDPHVWLDPVWVRERAVPSIQRALVAADPGGAAVYGENARATAGQLADLEEDIRAAFTRARTRHFLAWHPAWGRFAARFGLHSVGSLGESEGREPSLKAMVAAIRAGRGAGVRAVLVEPQQDDRHARVLAGELGVPLFTVDPLGDTRSLERATYGTLMLYNARAFARALGVVRDDEEDAARAPGAPPARH